MFDGDVPRLRRALLHHYDRHKRDLPWRHTADPYGIWVSEIMLQQTRVESVVPYYHRWMDRFPDLASLAQATEDDVLKQWQGLGYYSRARNLHKGALMVSESPAGTLPKDPAELRRIPGIGRYSAGAIASIAFGAHSAAVDGNVRRVLARLTDSATPGEKETWEVAEVLLDPERPGDFNQALMELGATICTPRSPRCPDCPVHDACGARAAGTVEERPLVRKRRSPRNTTFVVLVLVDPEGRALLQRRPPQGLLACMWAFPEDELGEGEVPLAGVARILARVGPQLGAGEREEARAAERMEPVRHTFTHLRATYLPYRMLWPPPASPSPGWCWVKSGEGEALALPVAQHKILSQTVCMHALNHRLVLSDL